MARDNRQIGKFTLDDIPPAPRGMPQIEVTFKIDANGILEVKAKDKATGKEQHISIQSSSGLGKDEIQRMVDEAAANAESDKAKEELAKARNQAEQLVHQTRTLMDEHKDKFEGSEEADITAAIAALEGLKASEDKNAIEAAVKELETKSQTWGKRIHEASMAKQQAAAGAAGGAGPQQAEPQQPQGGGDENIKDADFTVQK
jgi:molecular chaperone DnaK